MTARARIVLDDCRLVAAMLEDERNPQRWRIHWVTALALLRAVGHVLDKVDANDPLFRDTSRAAFGDWKGTNPRHEIFREFIERERNNVLKQYAFTVCPVDEVPVLLSTEELTVEGNRHYRQQLFALDGILYRPVVDGYRAGDDARDVLSDAIKWWDEQLTALESTSGSRRSRD